MENPDTLNAITAGLAILVFLGGILMMFTTFWTGAGKNKK